jgi:hypothetical protein
MLEAFQTVFPIDSRLLSLGPEGDSPKHDFGRNCMREMILSEAPQTGLLENSRLFSMECKRQNIPGAVDISVDVIA